MRRYLIPIIVILVLLSVTITGCALGIRVREDSSTPKEDAHRFAIAVLAVEDDRDDLIEEYQVFTKVFMDMSTRDVFEKADYFVKTHSALRRRMLDIETSRQEIKEVHTKYILGYAAENQAYLKLQSFLVSADEEKLYDSIKLFSEADTFFIEAMDMLDELLSKYGLSWSNIR